MTYRAERFNNSMRSLETMISGMVDASKSAKLSDRGKSAARMYAAFEPEPDAPDRYQELAGAVLRLIVEGMITSCRPCSSSLRTETTENGRCNSCRKEHIFSTEKC